MEYKKFATILDEVIFSRVKAELIKKIGCYADRYIGLFRPTRPETKLLQNLLQSHEIRFGGALERVIEAYLLESGYEKLPKTLYSVSQQSYDIDQFFRKDNYILLVEQKVRDDHDSTKKRGQVENFAEKIQLARNTFPNTMISGFFYFLDPSMKKNRNYYEGEIAKLAARFDTSMKLSLVYGPEFFEKLNLSVIWDEIEKHLATWKRSLPTLPQINFDMSPQASFEEIKDISPSIYLSIFQNDDIYEQIVKVISPEGKVVKLLHDYFSKKAIEKAIYAKVASIISSRLSK